MQYFFASNEFILYQNQDTAIIYKKNIRTLTFQNFATNLNGIEVILKISCVYF